MESETQIAACSRPRCKQFTMTTSGPQANAPPGWIESQSGDNEMDSRELEVGISGINLSSFTGNNRPPTLSGSSVSTNPEDQSHSRQHSQHSFGSYTGYVDPAGGHRGTPPSPASPMYRGQSMPSLQGKAPPGLSGPFPSPIGKAGSMNNTSTTAMSSPHLTLTPSSSIDQSDVFSTGRQSSPLGSNIPSYSDQLEAGESIRRQGSPWSESGGNIPRSVSAFTQPAGREGGFGGAFSASTDNDDDFDSDLDDGLRGLGALRERAHSSPGPLMTAGGGGFGSSQFSSSPPISSSNRSTGSPLHGDFRDDGSYGNRSFPSDPRRSRTPSSKDGTKAVSRPPRSGNVGTSHHFFNEGQESSRTVDWPQDSMGRGRSLSVGTMNSRDLMQIHQQDGDIHTQSHIDQSHAQKFGSLPSLSSHVQHQQRMPQFRQQHQFNEMQQPLGHVRSYSQPGLNPTGYRGQAEMHENPNVFEHNLEYSPAGGNIQFLDEGDSLHSGHIRGGDGGRYVQQVLPAQLSRSVSAGNHFAPQMHGQGLQPRNAAMSHPSLSSASYGEMPPVRRNSHTSGSQQYQNHPGLQRRDALDFDGRPSPVMATRDEMSMYGIYGREQEGYSIAGSSRHERLPQGGGVHNRHHSDGGGVLSSAIQGGRGMRGDIGHRGEPGSHQYASSFDDDLAHPLAGEFIDDPSDDLGPHMGGRSDRHEIPAYDMNDRMPSHGHSSGHSFSAPSVHDQPVMARHYNQVDSHHHGQMLPSRSMPRTVYNIKFKRSQRNFVAGPRINRDLDIGCYVKVEADRGEDLGIVVGKMSAEKFNQSAGRASFRPPSSNPTDLGASGTTPTCAADLKRVIRLATHDEVNLLSVKREEEDELLRICRTKVRQRALNMNVVDAEYQFDRHKLTFFFEAEGRVDFRELVRDLFSIYKTRIWMQQLDKNNGPSTQSIARGPSPTGDYDDDQKPIIAPEYVSSDGSNPHNTETNHAH